MTRVSEEVKTLDMGGITVYIAGGRGYVSTREVYQEAGLTSGAAQHWPSADEALRREGVKGRPLALVEVDELHGHLIDLLDGPTHGMVSPGTARARDLLGAAVLWRHRRAEATVDTSLWIDDGKVPTLEQIEAAALLLLERGADPTVARLCDRLGVSRTSLHSAHGASVREAIDRARAKAIGLARKPAEDAKPLARSTDFTKRRARFQSIMQRKLEAKRQQQTSPVLRLPVADATALDPRLESALVDLSAREVCPTMTTRERLEVVRLALEVRAQAGCTGLQIGQLRKIDALVDAALKEVL